MYNSVAQSAQKFFYITGFTVAINNIIVKHNTVHTKVEIDEDG